MVEAKRKRLSVILNNPPKAIIKQPIQIQTAYGFTYVLIVQPLSWKSPKAIYKSLFKLLFIPASAEAGINSSLKRDLYIALGDFQDNGWTIRTYVKPYAVWIWIGCLIMAFGGLLSMTDRRLRFASTIRLKQK